MMTYHWQSYRELLARSMLITAVRLSDSEIPSSTFHELDEDGVHY